MRVYDTTKLEWRAELYLENCPTQELLRITEISLVFFLEENGSVPDPDTWPELQAIKDDEFIISTICFAGGANLANLIPRGRTVQVRAEAVQHLPVGDGIARMFVKLNPALVLPMR